MAYFSESDLSETSLWMDRDAYAGEVPVSISQTTDGLASSQHRSGRDSNPRSEEKLPERRYPILVIS